MAGTRTPCRLHGAANARLAANEAGSGVMAVERMNCALTDATVKTYHDPVTHDLKEHLQAFLMASHVAKRLNTLSGIPVKRLLAQLTKGASHIDCERTLLVVKISIEEIGWDCNPRFDHRQASAWTENVTDFGQEFSGPGQVV